MAYRLNARIRAAEAKAARLLAAAEPVQFRFVWCDHWGDCRKPNCDCQTVDGEPAYRLTGGDNGQEPAS